MSSSGHILNRLLMKRAGFGLSQNGRLTGSATSWQFSFSSREFNYLPKLSRESFTAQHYKAG